MSAPERLNEIEARANAATKGPWEAYRPNPIYRIYEICSTTPQGLDETLAEVSGYNASDDAEFMAAARDDVPALAKAVKAVLARHTPRPFADAEVRAISPSLPEQVCDHCTNLAGRPVRFPCPDVCDIEDSIP